MNRAPKERNSFTEIAHDLARLASEKSSDKRLELLRRITDVYLETNDSQSASEKYLFNDLITGLVDKFTGADRAWASAHLAQRIELPPELAHKLACDRDIDVARPIVRDYRALPEKTLIEVAKTGSQEHLHAIASRSHLTPPVSSIVVDRGDTGVVRALAGNKGAQFSTQGMARLIDKAERDATLQTLLVDRQDLSLDAVGRLLPIISEELAERLRTTVLDEETIRDHVVTWMEERKGNAAGTEAYVQGIRAGHLKLNDVAMELLRAKRLLDCAAVVAAALDIDPHYAFRQLTHGKIQSALLLLRSVELPWPTVDRFLKLRQAKSVPAATVRDVTRADYESIDIAVAQRVVRFMKVRRTAMTTAAASA